MELVLLEKPEVLTVPEYPVIQWNPKVLYHILKSLCPYPETDESSSYHPILFF
jgi:hypothetical protein